MTVGLSRRRKMIETKPIIKHSEMPMSVYEIKAGQKAHATCLSKYTTNNPIVTITAIFPATYRGVQVCPICGGWIERKEAVYIKSITWDFSKIITNGD